MTTTAGPRARMSAGLPVTPAQRRAAPAPGNAAARHGWPLHVIDDATHAPHIERPNAFVQALTTIAAATG